MNRTESLLAIGKMLEIPSSQLNENLKPSDVESWDSMGHINILAFLDTEFGISLSTAEMARIESIKSVLDVIESRGGFTR